VPASGGGGDGGDDDGADGGDGVVDPIECPYGLLDCAGDCVDPKVDPANCGGCGVGCGTGAACVSGTCEAPVVCGDGLCDETETAVSCGSDCAPAVVDEAEPNDACPTAQEIYAISDVVEGDLSDSTDEDWFRVAIDEAGTVEVRTNDTTGDGCGRTSDVGTDTLLEVYRTDCATRIAASDDDGTSYCSRVVLSDVAPGDLLVRVRAFTVGIDRSYALEVVR